MSLNALGLGFVFTAKDEASHVIHKLHDGMHGLQNSAHASGNSMVEALGMGGKALASVSVALGAAAAAGAFEFAEHAEKFSSAIRQAGVASHATAEQMEELEHLAMGKGLDSIRGSAIGAAEAIRELALEGYDAHDAAAALDGTLSLMKISMGALSAQNAAGLVNDTLGQFSMRADQATELADKLAFAMKNFGFRANELQGVMSGLASGAQLTGASLEDTLIGVGLMKSVLPSATKAAGAMNAAMQQLASTRGQKELGLIGVRVTDATGKIRPLVDIMGQLAQRTAGMTDAMIAHKLESIAGGKAAGGLSAMIDGLRKGVTDASGTVLTGSAAIEHLRKEMANTEGTAKKMAAILGDDMGGAISALKNAFSNAGVAIGAGFEGPFKHAIQSANLFIRGMTQLFTEGGFSGEVKEALDKNLGIKGFAINTFMWIKRIQNYFSSLGESFMRTFEPFRPLLGTLENSFGQLGRALGLTGQTAGDNASKWDELGAVGGQVGSILANVAGSVLPVLTSAVQLVTEGVQSLRDTWDSMKPAIMGVYPVLSGTFGMIAGLLNGNWKTLWDGFVDVVVGASQLVMNIVFGALGGLAKAFDRFGSVFGSNLGLSEKLNAFQNELNAGVTSGTQVLKSVVAAPGSPGSAAGTAIASNQMIARSVAAPTASAVSAAMAEQNIQVTVPLHIDGEKMVEAHARAKRTAGARGFRAVPSHEGGF